MKKINCVKIGARCQKLYNMKDGYSVVLLASTKDHILPYVDKGDFYSDKIKILRLEDDNIIKVYYSKEQNILFAKKMKWKDVKR
jgi:hypothetical protein